MSLFILICLFFVGACIGSFLAVLIEKNTFHRSFWTGRSQCAGCDRVLQWYELIPLLSYLLQWGKCRTCGATIPRWIWYMEWYIAFLWMITAMVLSANGFSLISILLHTSILTGISLLVIEDVRFQTISDSKTIPLIGLLILVFVWSHYSDEKTLFPDDKNMIIIGGFTGMFFFMIQMILPALIETVRRHDKTSNIYDILLSPFIFPFWMVVKVLFGEKKADAWFPSLSLYDMLPSWVGGGDIRLGLIIGLLVGPYEFLFVVLYGYVLGTIFFGMRWMVTGYKMQTMPVAPLLFVGLCGVWLSQIIR